MCQKLSRIIVVSLYRHCFSISEEQLFLKFTAEICKEIGEKVKGTDKLQLPEFFLEIFNSHVRYTSVRDYLENTLRGTLFGIIEQEFFRETKNPKTEFQETSFYSNLATRLLQHLISEVESMPFGLRVLVKQVHSLACDLQLSEKNKENIMRDLIFDNLFIRCILHPDIYAGVRGVYVRPELISKLAKKFQELVYSQDLSIFFEKLINIDDENLVNVVSERSLYNNLYISKMDFESIVDILATPSPNQIEIQSPLVDLLKRFIFEVKLNTSLYEDYPKISPECLLSISLPIQKEITEFKNDIITQEVRRKLNQVLSNIIEPIQLQGNLLDLLYNSCTFWNPNQSSSLAQIKEVIRCLNQLPDQYKEENFSILIDQLTKVLLNVS